MIVHGAVLVSAFAILWFLAFFCLLPIGLGAVDSETGAPKHPHLMRKAAYATAIAAVLFSLFCICIQAGLLDL